MDKTKKKEVEKVVAKKPVAKSITVDDLNNVYVIVKEMQANLDFVNDKLEKCMSRLGVE